MPVPQLIEATGFGGGGGRGDLAANLGGDGVVGGAEVFYFDVRQMI